jgi:hypothetical protein
MIFVWSINGSSMEQDFKLVLLKVVVNLNELIEFVEFSMRCSQSKIK